jgi:hypothetical protein
MITLASQSGAASHKHFSTAVWLMNNCRYFAVLALLLPSMAEAASVIKPIVACKDEADSRKVLDFLGKKDTAGLDKFSAPKLAKGDCFSLSKGMAVTIDTKDGTLLCVRPWGGLDCYWTADADIDQNPAEPETRPATHSGGHRHGGANLPPP